MGVEQLVLRSGVHVSQTRWPIAVQIERKVLTGALDPGASKDTTSGANGERNGDAVSGVEAAHTDSQSHALNIHSMMFMYGPALRTTKEFLSSALVTHFSLGYVTLEKVDWGRALPMLSFPTLQSFTLSHCNLPFDRLVQFLDRHPTIKALRLGGGLLDPPPDPLPEDSLPNLLSLVTPASHLHWLLHHKRHTLVSPCILVQVSRRTPFSKFLQSISSTPSTLHSYDVALHITLEVYASRLLLTDLLSIESQPEYRDFLQSIKAIEITSLWKELREFCPVLASWLALFPELRTLAIPIPSYPTLPSNINPFVEQLKNRCQNLRTIRLPDGIVEIFQGPDGRRYKRFVS
ncbi:hypothetical protein BDN72DRAFT_845522 [Pluteus cervinus]|uniref:Uncharacterized protein n=1 Tax=Pluteus cervinus TaxID=181527 RepID=A0ACD3AKU3_9AGAR|nr:hypothetical protein BDN72DRAFT_845522 [Pluteus cervinus]